MDNTYSLGTAPVVSKLQEIISGNNAPDTFLVNILTLIRNVASTSQNPDEKVTKTVATLVKETSEEFNNLVRDVSSMFAKNNTVNPNILVYCADYAKMIPASALRVQPDSKKSLYLTNTSILNTVLTQPKSVLNVGKTVVTELSLKSREPVYTTLISEIQNFRNRHKVVMLSHIAYDYHIVKSIPDFSLINSFTGNTVSANELGKKVFNNDDVNFTTYLHSLLGDKELIKGTLSITEKKKLFELAKEKQLKIKTRDYTNETLKQNFQIKNVI